MKQRYVEHIKGTRKIKMDLSSSRLERERILREELKAQRTRQKFEESKKAGLERLLQFKSAYPTFRDGRGMPKKFRDADHMRSMVEGYFESCFSPIINRKTGELVYTADGEIKYYQHKPFTFAGLALALGTTPRQIDRYIHRSLNGEDDPSYAEVLIPAKLRIQEFAECHLYDKDASNGAKFVLQTMCKVTTAKEDSEINSNYGKLELAKKEFDLKKRLIDDDGDEDTTINVNIIRAKPKGGE